MLTLFTKIGKQHISEKIQFSYRKIATPSIFFLKILKTKFFKLKFYYVTLSQKWNLSSFRD